MKTDKNRIVDYIVVNLSKKAVKASDFCTAAGLPINLVSHMKNPAYHAKLGDAVWEFLEKVYQQAAFDKVVSRQLRYEGVRKKPEKKTEPSPEKEIVVTEIDKDLEKGTYNGVQNPPMKPDVKDPEEGESPVNPSDLYKTSDFNLKAKTGDKDPIDLTRKEAGTLLENTDISLGTAIDVLLKSGARFNISIQLTNTQM